MCSAIMAEGVHPIPFRTRKLSPPAPMVLRRRPWESRTLLSTSDGFDVSAADARTARLLLESAGRASGCRGSDVRRNVAAAVMHADAHALFHWTTRPHGDFEHHVEAVAGVAHLRPRDHVAAMYARQRIHIGQLAPPFSASPLRPLCSATSAPSAPPVSSQSAKTSR